MMYIGSGPLGGVLAAADPGGIGPTVWGRRLRRVKLADLRAVRGRDVLYLDTVDVGSCSELQVRLRWLVTPYRIEKTVMYYLLRAVAARVVRVHVTAITDSAAWKRLIVDARADAVEIRGFTYRALVELLGKVVSSNAEIRRIRSSELCELARANGVLWESLRVDAHNFSSRLIKGLLCSG